MCVYRYEWLITLRTGDSALPVHDGDVYEPAGALDLRVRIDPFSAFVLLADLGRGCNSAQNVFS